MFVPGSAKNNFLKKIGWGYCVLCKIFIYGKIIQMCILQFIYNLIFIRPTSGEAVLHSKLVNRRARFNPQSCLSTQLFEVFSKTRVNTDQDPLERPPTEGTPPTGPGSTSEQFALFVQPKLHPFVSTQKVVTSNYQLTFTKS